MDRIAWADLRACSFSIRPHVRFVVAKFFRPVLIMVTKLGDEQAIVRGLVDEAVFVVDPTGPVPFEGVFEGLGLADAGERLAGGFADELVDPGQGLCVCLLPVKVILPGGLGEDEFHYVKALSRPWPDSSSEMALSKRIAFFGLRRR